MKRNIFTSSAAVLALTTLTLVGCKTGTEADSLINHIKLSQDSQSFEYTTVFGSNIDIDMEAEIPVGNYGSVSFFKNDQGQFSVKLKATLDVFGDTSLMPVTTLPNGMSFPSLVSGSMYQMKVAKSVNAYFDNQLALGIKKLAGLSIQFDNISNNLPQITITQSFFSNTNQKYASLTVFGPTTKNGVTYPGGIFLVGDINQVIDSATLTSKSVKIAGPEAYKFKTEQSQQMLLLKVKKAFEAAGVKLK